MTGASLLLRGARFTRGNCLCATRIWRDRVIYREIPRAGTNHVARGRLLHAGRHTLDAAGRRGRDGGSGSERGGGDGDRNAGGDGGETGVRSPAPADSSEPNPRPKSPVGARDSPRGASEIDPDADDVTSFERAVDDADTTQKPDSRRGTGRTTTTQSGRRRRSNDPPRESAGNDSTGKPSTGKSSPNGPGGSEIQRVTVPKEYPQVLAIPLAGRPLFPGFYKTLSISDPEMIAAIKNRVDARQPYVGVFLTRSAKNEADLIQDADDVYAVGVFAQITNMYFSDADQSKLTLVVYPHRRIRMSSVLCPRSSGPNAAVAVETPEKDAGATPPLWIVSTPRFESATESLRRSNPTPEDTPAGRQEPPASSPTPPQSTAEALELFEPVNLDLHKFRVAVARVDNLELAATAPEGSESPETATSLVKATVAEILNVLKDISYINTLLRDQIITFSIQNGVGMFQDPARLADFGAAVSSGEPRELQAVLESVNVEDRLHRTLVLLKQEHSNAKLQQEIAKEVDKKITRKQQEYFLMEQLKGIKKELGLEVDAKEKLVEQFVELASKLQMPEAVRKVFDEELRKLQHLETAASEFNVTRSYLDWLTQIPWGKRVDENLNVAHATAVLDEDHYGLKDVKDRILEFIAVGKLRGTVQGKILCLVGPPGVGKTSVGRSIARALNRPFYRFSVGGLVDVAEIKGHRRTYVGAMPGKVIQALKQVQSENPLILIDEVDKLGKGHQGDPASALLELLDPEQNSAFLDHYMDVPVDLSRVLFVCTANVLDTLPGPLLDRMEVITLSGYVADEKHAIAKQYLVPQIAKASGLEGTPPRVVLEDSAIARLIRSYCRESGVRNLRKQIDKVYRKAALKLVRASEPAGSKPVDEPLVVTDATLVDYVGNPPFSSDRMYEETPAGVVMGLAWTSMGGSALYIESVLEAPLPAPGTDEERAVKAAFHHTGQLGDVMKESARIAYTFARSFVTRKFPDARFFQHAQIHMHVPEGATPKDGPSAGVTMTTALLSLALSRPVPPNLAMTGEITLTGKVLKVGGIKEKTIAAKRCGVSTIVLPRDNEPDWKELPAFIQDGVTPVFVEWYDEVFARVFPVENDASDPSGRLQVEQDSGRVVSV